MRRKEGKLPVDSKLRTPWRMDVTMSKKSKDEYLQKMRWRYGRRTGKAAKSCLIDEFSEVTGYERKYAIKLLRGVRKPPDRPPVKRGRKCIYDEEVIKVIKEIWLLNEQPCGKRLVPVLPIWLKSYEQRHGRLPRGVAGKISQISPSQVDRVLETHRASICGRRRRPPRSNAAIKAATPIRAQAWDVHEPGWLEADTVAHCGGSMDGSFLWTLDNTDIFSGWTEVRSVWNNGKHGVCERFTEIESTLPFALKGVDTDNGSEFLNWHFKGHFENREPRIELTRSRPYRKNDQAHVEQKNYTHVRLLLGYDRLDHKGLEEPINELLVKWSLWRNLYCATMKQIKKKREQGKLIRRHEKHPQTPCQRLMDYWQARGERKPVGSLKRLRAGHDPIEMKEDIEKRLKDINQLINRLRQESEVGV